MSDNRKRDIFYGVVAVATLIVALIGATLAYFSMSAKSSEGAVNATAATVSIEYKDGQNVIAQADALIPSSLSVVQTSYLNSDNQTALANQLADPENYNTNVCLDAAGQQVCSIYRFSLKSDVNRTATAYLRSEDNQFQYLAYAVRDVTNGAWLVLDAATGAQSRSLTKCDNTSDNDADKCFTFNVSDEKVYNAIAQNSIFGYQTNASAVTKSITDTEQEYDLLLFILENNDNQDVDQGKEFRGTIVVDVSGANTQITGQ